MSHWTLHFSTHKQVAELFTLLKARIGRLGIEQDADVKSYISYRCVVSRVVIMYIHPRRKWLHISLDIPAAQITETGTLILREDTTWKEGKIYSWVRFESADQIEDIISLIQQAYSYNCKEAPPSPRVLNRKGNALGSEQHTRITESLKGVYDIVEGVANQIKRALPPCRNESTGEWEVTEADRCATELLDAVRKLQVVMSNDSGKNGNDTELP